MMIRARRLKSTLSTFLTTYPNDKIPTFTSSEWKHIDYLIEILHPFHSFTNAVGKIRSGPSIHQVYAIYNRLFTHIEDYIEKLARKTLPWKRQIHTALQSAERKLRSYYSDTKDDVGSFYAIATILDPTKKLDAFQTDEWKDDDINWVSD